MRQALVWTLLTVAACSIPDPTQVPLRCDQANPCPSGRLCLSSGECSDPPDMTVSGQDAAAPVDMTSTPNPDLLEPNGCKDGNGTKLGAGQWRCPGAFGSGANPKASAMCASGYAVCQTLDAAAQQACNALPGFFASTVIGSRKDGTPYGTGQCDQRELHAVVYGCGNGLAATMTCSGFDKLIDCNQQIATWTCATTIDATSQKNALNGVLCCKS